MTEQVTGVLDSMLAEEAQEVSKKVNAGRSTKKVASQSVGSENLGNDPTVSAIDDRDLDAFMENWDNMLLPDPPEVPGWHTFWASTTNKYDPIEARIRGGYRYVKPSDIPNFNPMHYQTRMNSGSFGSEEVISVNEMVLMMCPQELFNRRMMKYHHKEPLGQQKHLVDKMRSIADKLDVNQVQTPLEQGMLDMEAETKRENQIPEFFVNTKR